MAFYAFQSFMFAIQPETGLVMVEFVRRPVIECMTPLTIIVPVIQELAGMDILVTIFTAFTDAGKLLQDFASGLFKMALPAACGFMPAFQTEFCPVVVEGNGIP